jgi:hypothetical protein
MDYLRQIFWMLTVPMSSFLGYFFLKHLSIKKDLKSWKISFSEKKVLIVGSGPSLDRVNNHYFANFDAILYINHAIKCSGKVDDEYFFSTDVSVTEGIKNKVYYNKIKQFGSERSILAPIFFQQTLFLTKKFRKTFSWIVASEASYRGHRLSRPVFEFHLPITAVYWPQQPSYIELDNWFLQKHQVNFFPVIGSTSALSAILFVAKYSPKNITLIGCDFSVGRSESIVNDCPAHNVNIFTKSREKFNYLQEYLSKNNILIKNDSWL